MPMIQQYQSTSQARPVLWILLVVYIFQSGYMGLYSFLGSVAFSTPHLVAWSKTVDAPIKVAAKDALGPRSLL